MLKYICGISNSNSQGAKELESKRKWKINARRSQTLVPDSSLLGSCYGEEASRNITRFSSVVFFICDWPALVFISPLAFHVHEYLI